MISVQATAKINPTLEVIAKRPDGYHEIRSVIQAITLADTLVFEPSDGLVFTCDLAEWRAERSLAYKAATLLREMTGCDKGASIHIHKRIPLTAGLGGDSSDAAAVLKGLNSLWKLELPMERLLEAARRLGSDVSFFLYGGTAVLEGRGEIIKPLPSLPHRWALIIMPSGKAIPDKTAHLYRRLLPAHFTNGEITRRLVDVIKRKSDMPSSLFFNTFENVAFNIFSGLAAVRERLIKLGAENVHLAGAGPSLFTILQDKIKAEQLYSVIHRQGFHVFLAETMPETV